LIAQPAIQAKKLQSVIELSNKAYRNGDDSIVVALEKAICDYLDAHNEQPKPFRWTKSANEIIASVNSVLKRINQTGHLRWKA
jgi:hypothetical protein